MKQLLIIASLLLSFSTFGQNTVFYSQEGENIKVVAVKKGEIYEAVASDFPTAVKYLKYKLALELHCFSAEMTDDEARTMVYTSTLIFKQEDDDVHIRRLE